MELEPLPARAPSQLSLPAAALGGIPLLRPTRDPFGGSFTLLAPARGDTIQPVGNDGEIEVRSGRSLVVVRGSGSPSTYEDALAAALAVAQLGLDLLSVRGVDNLSITRGVKDHLVWWTTSGATTLRIANSSTLRFDAPPVRAIVTDSQGNQKPDPPLPDSSHPSFRFFRLSQISDDAFDAFRNAYLALESLFSDVIPMTLRANGKPDESEKAWLQRCLADAASRVNLASFAPPSSKDPAGDFISEIYEATRTAIFHAKHGRRVLMPHDSAAREEVARSIERATRLYVALVEAYLGIRRYSGGIFAVAFRMMTEQFVDATLYLSDDASPIDPSDVVLNPAGGALVPMQMVKKGDVVGPRTREWLGEISVSGCRLPHVIRLGLGMSEPIEPIAAALIEGELTLGCLTTIQGYQALEIQNVREVKTDYIL